MICTWFLAYIPLVTFPNCLKFHSLDGLVKLRITILKYISLVVSMPNTTTNQAVTYTNSWRKNSNSTIVLTTNTPPTWPPYHVVASQVFHLDGRTAVIVTNVEVKINIVWLILGDSGTWIVVVLALYIVLLFMSFSRDESVFRNKTQNVCVGFRPDLCICTSYLLNGLIHFCWRDSKRKAMD